MLKVKLLVAQSYTTLCNPMSFNLPVSSVHGILQARILEWIAISFPRGIFPTQGGNLCFLLWQADSLALAPPGNSRDSFHYLLICLCHVLAAMYRIFNCATRTLSWDKCVLVPWPGIERRPSALGAWSLSHWTTKEVLLWLSLWIVSRRGETISNFVAWEEGTICCVFPALYCVSFLSC